MLRVGHDPDRHLIMSTPRRPPSGRQKSPKEDGEIGESLEDVLSRHPHDITPGMGAAVAALRDNEDLLTPQSGAFAGRMASAVLSLMAHKPEPEDAKEAFVEIVYDVEQCRRTRSEEAAFQVQLEKDFMEAYHDREELYQLEAGEERRRVRDHAPSVLPVKRRKRDNHGRMRV